MCALQRRFHPFPNSDAHALWLAETIWEKPAQQSLIALADMYRLLNDPTDVLDITRLAQFARQNQRTLALRHTLQMLTESLDTPALQTMLVAALEMPVSYREKWSRANPKSKNLASRVLRHIQKYRRCLSYNGLLGYPAYLKQIWQVKNTRELLRQAWRRRRSL